MCWRNTSLYFDFSWFILLIFYFKNPKHKDASIKSGGVKTIEKMRLPPLHLALVPIVLPIILIALGTLLNLNSTAVENGLIVDSVVLISAPKSALLIGVLFSFMLLIMEI